MAMPFDYQPLRGPDSIRLLNIHSAGQESDQLICSLEPAQLGECRYEALSYVWGNAQARKAIICNDGIISITENCYRALRSLTARRITPTSSHLRLWVDAICINQSDSQERSSQVLLLPRIFESATAVIAWLGDEDIPRNRVSHSLTSMSANYLRRSRETEWHSLLPLLSHSWWTRIWVVQEVMLSSQLNILLDHEEMGWKTFWDRVHSEMKQSPDHGKVIPTSVKSGLRFYSLASTSKTIQFLRKEHKISWWYYDPGLERAAVAELVRILDFSSTLIAADPRDKIYGLFELLQPVGIKIPAPDYSKTVRMVFEEARFALIKRIREVGDYVKPIRVPEQCAQRHVYLRQIQVKQPMPIEIHLDKQHDNSRPEVLKKSSTPDLNGDPDVVDTVLESCIPPGVLQHTEEETEESSDGEEYVTETTHPSFFDDFINRHKQSLLKQAFEHLGSMSLRGTATNCCGSTDASQNGSIGNAGSNQEHGESNNKAKGTESQEQARGSRRKRDDGENEDEENDGRRPTKQPKDRTWINPRNRFACPYFQRNSQSPRLRASCRGYGFDTISRLKEHLYRTHHIHPCDRCGEIFVKRSSVTEHLRSLQVCDSIAWRAIFDPAEGFDDQQQEGLRRKTVRTWNQIFKILFPEDPESSYPPQCYCNTEFVELLDKFHTYYLLGIRRLIPQRLTAATFLSTVPLHQQDEVRNELLNIVNEIHNEILTSFRRDALKAAASSSQEVPTSQTNDITDAGISHGVMPMVGANDFSDPNSAFLTYIYQVAPEGTLGSMNSIGFHDLGVGATGIPTNNPGVLLGPQEQYPVRTDSLGETSSRGDISALDLSDGFQSDLGGTLDDGPWSLIEHE